MQKPIAVLLLTFAATVLLAAEEPPLIKEDFDQFKLESPPGGWKKDEAANLSLVDEPGRGKVLKIVNKTGQTSSLEFRLDAHKVAGKILEIKACGKLLKVYEKVEGKFYAGPKIKCCAKSTDNPKPVYVNLTLKNSDTDWKTLEGRFIVPAKATIVTIGACIELSASEALFDSLTVTVFTPSKAPAPKPEEKTPEPVAQRNKPEEPRVELAIKQLSSEKKETKNEPGTSRAMNEKTDAEVQRLYFEAEKLMDQAVELKAQAAELKAKADKIKADSVLPKPGREKIEDE